MILYFLCQVTQSLRVTPGAGLADGETLERLWSYLRSFSSMTKGWVHQSGLTCWLMHCVTTHEKFDKSWVKHLSLLLPPILQNNCIIKFLLQFKNLPVDIFILYYLERMLCIMFTSCSMLQVCTYHKVHFYSDSLLPAWQ